MTSRPLRDYQVEACDAIELAWTTARSTLLVLPTGMGKTRVISEVLRRRASAGVALVLAHRRELIEQAAASIAEDGGLLCEVEQAQRRASLVGTLYGQAQVVVGSVATMQGKRLERWPEDWFKTVVIDEAHHATAASYRAILKRFPNAKVLGVTATPDRGDEVGLSAVFETCAYQYEIREAIRAGWLCPIHVRTIECADLQLDDIKVVRGDLAQEELERALSVDKVLHQISAPLVREAGDRSTIVFTAGVEQAKALAQVMGGYTDRAIETVDGSTPEEVRADVLARFRSGDVQFLLNCAVLTEGFDAPRTACVAMARPTKSRALYQQCLGRGTRIAPGKDGLLVLDFVGNGSRHRLVTVIDVLAGKPIGDDVRRRAEKFIGQGEDAERALAKAHLEAAREERLERELAVRRRDAAERKRARVQADVTYIARDVDPFVTGRDHSGAPATDGVLRYLREVFGADLKQASQREAQRLLDTLKARQRAGLATYKQTVLLRRMKLNPDLPREEASKAISALREAKWRATSEIRSRWGPGGDGKIPGMASVNPAVQGPVGDPQGVSGDADVAAR